MAYLLYNHQTGSLSPLDMEMIRHVPPGGNWKDIPGHIPSKRLEGIRRTGGRTTYYGRLAWDKPAYTITTYFNRPGNGTYIHPEQDRLISFREAARLQSFPDGYRFFGPKRALLVQIGNAVPPLLAEAIARAVPGETVADIFSGAGGLSLGFALAGYTPIAALELDRHAAKTYAHNHPGVCVVQGDATQEKVLDAFTECVFRKVAEGKLDALVGGPPCQGFSTAGRRRANDPRNLLWKAYFQAVERLRPRWFLMENVPGLRSMWAVDEAGQPTGRKVLDLLQEEAARLGYTTTSLLLQALAHGVPQRRQRLFLLGFRQGEGMPDLSSLGLSRWRSVSVWEAIGNLPPLGPGEGEEVLLLEALPAETPYQAWVQGELELHRLP